MLDHNFWKISGIVFWVAIAIYAGLRIFLGEKWFLKLGGRLVLGGDLLTVSQELSSELKSKSVKESTLIEFGVHVFWRLTRVGVLGLLIAVFPILLLVQQNDLLRDQNYLFSLQDSLILSQNIMLEEQLKLFNEQNNKIDLQTSFLASQTDLFSRQNDLLDVQNRVVEEQNILAEKNYAIELYQQLRESISREDQSNAIRNVSLKRILELRKKGRIESIGNRISVGNVPFNLLSLNNETIEGFSFTFTRFHEPTWSEVKFVDCDFEGVLISEPSFKDVRFVKSNFIGLQFGTEKIQGKLNALVNYMFKIWEYNNPLEYRIKADFVDCTFQQSSFAFSDLRNVKIDLDVFSKSDIESGIFFGCIFMPSQLVGVSNKELLLDNGAITNGEQRDEFLESLERITEGNFNNRERVKGFNLMVKTYGGLFKE